MAAIRFDSDQGEIEPKLIELLAERPAALQALALQVRRHILELTGSCRELLYETQAVSNVFTYSGKIGDGFIHIATYRQHLNLGFNRGSQLDDPKGLLQGSGKSIRHIRIDSGEELTKKDIDALIRQAILQGQKQVMQTAGD